MWLSLFFGSGQGLDLCGQSIQHDEIFWELLLCAEALTDLSEGSISHICQDQRWVETRSTTAYQITCH